MAKNNWVMPVIIIAAAFLLFGDQLGINLGGGTSTGTGTGTTSINFVEDTTATVYIYDKYAPTTTLSARNATIYSSNGGQANLGKTAHSGSVTVSPGDVLTIEWDSTDEAPGAAYYGYVETKTVPKDKGQINLMAYLPAVSTSPTFTWFDENEQPSTALALGASETYLAEIKLKSEADKAFGNPAAPIDNVVCVRYNTTEYSNVIIPGASSIGRPESITNVSSGFTHKCFNSEKIADTDSTRVTLQLETASTQPDSESKSLEVCYDDAAMYKNADNDQLEWGYVDEDNTALAATAVCSCIDVS